MFGLTKYFCTNVSLLCTVGSVDVFFIAIFESYLNKSALGSLIPESCIFCEDKHEYTINVIHVQLQASMQQAENG